MEKAQANLSASGFGFPPKTKRKAKARNTTKGGLATTPSPKSGRLKRSTTLKP